MPANTRNAAGKVIGNTCDGIFCEMEWQCVASDFSQLNIKGEQMMSFITTNKDYRKTLGPCTTVTRALCDRYGEIFQKSANGYQCACIKMENQFNVGAEGMTLNFQHMFTPSAKSGIKPKTHNVCGAKDVRMSLWRTDEATGRVTLQKKFDLGAPAKYPVREWLKMVGVNSLDDRNIAAHQGGWVLPNGKKMEEAAMVGVETFRMTGVGIGLDFIWGGDMREEDGYVFPSSPSSHCSSVQLHVKARLIPGWQSLGSEVHYSDRTVVDVNTNTRTSYKNDNDYPIRDSDAGFETMTYHDRYKRGVKFEFTYHGKLGHFDAMAFITRISSFIVLLGVAEVFVSALAFTFMGYKSKVYRRGRDDVMHIEREHAKIAVATLTAAATFRALAAEGADKLHWSEIRDYLKGFDGISEVDAGKLATRMLEEGDLDRDGGLSLEEFTNMVTEESGMLHQCIEHLDYIETKSSSRHAVKAQATASLGSAPATGAADGGAPGRVQVMDQHGMLQLHATVPPGFAPGMQFKVGVPDGRIMAVVVPPNHAPGAVFTFCVPPLDRGPPTARMPLPSAPPRGGAPAPLGQGDLVLSLQQQQQQHTA